MYIQYMKTGYYIGRPLTELPTPHGKDVTLVIGTLSGSNGPGTSIAIPNDKPRFDDVKRDV